MNLEYDLPTTVILVFKGKSPTDSEKRLLP